MDMVIGVASSVVEKILEYPVGLICRHLGYLICYQTNKKSLADRVPELDDEIRDVQHRAQEAQNKGEKLFERVTRWISEAERRAREAKDVIADRGHENAECSCNGSFPNLVSRYKLSKKAKIMAENIVMVLQKADNFGNFSYRLPSQPSFKSKDYEAFDTRMQTSNEIMEALRDPNLTMIGVYGMGGIGKTTLVTEVASQAKEEECFSELVMVTVSQDFDLKSIQNRIAEGLGLTLDGENMSVRAKLLQDRLRQGNKIFIILDDIWNELDLSEAGISFNADDQKGCKILLVSRNRDVLFNNKMGVTKIIEVKVLSESEAQGLFNKFVGDIDDNSEFKELANRVVRECGGLPIAIVTIACSLKNKDIFVWKDFLSRLKSSRGMEGKVYSSIKMSYDVLESEEKKLLLLCCLHGEDANVPVNELMFYGIGLHLFQGLHTIEGARCRAHSLVDKLKAHCLLLDGDYEDTVKMHDVIRDVMILIAKIDEHMHCLTKVDDLEECLDKENFRDSKAIMLLGRDFNNQLLPSLVCPNLQLLLARGAQYWYPYLFLGTIPDDFFKEAQELKALSFYCHPLQSLPQSFCTLRHLRALRLRLDKNEDLTLIGELTNLIALDLSGSTFSQLPEHIGRLTRLRSLSLSDCTDLKVIQPNVISSLVRLEELYMDKVDIDWEVEGRVGEGRKASLVEFKNLRHLTTLHLNVRDTNVLPKDMFSENLQRYRIVIGSDIDYPEFDGSRLLCLQLDESSQPYYLYGIQKLMKNSEGMFLDGFEGIDGIDGIVYELDTDIFSQLKVLDVCCCPNLKYLFTVAMAGKLAQLETLKIRECTDMEEVVVTNEHGEGRLEKNSFPKLKYLELQDLPNLRRFCTGDCLEFPSLTNMKIIANPAMRTFITDSSNGASGELKGSEARQPFFNGKVTFPKLQGLYVMVLHSVNYLFSFAVAKSLVTLKGLDVSHCRLMEEIVQVNEQGEEGRILFPKLERIYFYDLSNLKRFYGGACIEFPSLLNLTVQIKNRVVLGPNLEELATTSSELIKEVCDCQSSRAPPFCNVKVVDLECFSDEPIGFSLKCIQRYQNLESLSLRGYIVDTTHHHQQLMVSSEEHERPLTHLYGDSEDSENSSLESLKFLRIQECNRLKSPLLSSTTSFQNLMALVVSECSALINLLASSTAKTLVHLRLMSITECKQMTEIIAGGIVDDDIVFGKLEVLELSDLPSLRSFHSAGNSVMRFPNLVMLAVSQCPEMRRFAFGTIDAPKLDSISEIEKEKHRWDFSLSSESIFDNNMSWLPEPQQKLWEGDINKTLEKLWEEDSLVMQRLFTET